MDYSGLNPQMNFIGIDNYVRAFQDEVFLKALGNTLIFVVGTIPFTTGIALLLALLLNNRQLKSKGIFKAGFFLPSVISMVVISTIWIYLYSSNGLFNTIGSFLGFKMESRSWLASPDTALVSIMIMNVWAAFGYYLILIYAGLQNVPEQLYEAAKIDGATPTQIALKITLPYIKPTLFFVISINTIRSFQIFSEIYTMTGGGPRNSTQTIVHYLYQVGFRKFEMGYGSSIAYILLTIIMIVTLIQKYLLRSDDV
jgi:multiple sugar transport system permease protein